MKKLTSRSIAATCMIALLLGAEAAEACRCSSHRGIWTRLHEPSPSNSDPSCGPFLGERSTVPIPALPPQECVPLVVPTQPENAKSFFYVVFLIKADGSHLYEGDFATLSAAADRYLSIKRRGELVEIWQYPG